MATDSGNIKITLVRSLVGRTPRQRACVSGLGLRRMHQTVERMNTPEVRGMIGRVSFMLKVEEVA